MNKVKTKGKVNKIYKKNNNKKKNINKPFITIYSRKKMTPHEAQTQSIPSENIILTLRSLDSSKKYIRNNGDIKKVYVLRDEKNKLITSYSYHKNRWAPINMGGYFGGYKIGNPRPVCSCGFGACNDPYHPTYNNTQ